MKKKDLEEKLRAAKNIRFRKHAIIQMRKRNIAKGLVIEKITHATVLDHIIEKDSESKKHTIGFSLSNRRDLYITMRFKKEDIYIITAIISSKKVVENIRKRLSRWKRARQ